MRILTWNIRQGGTPKRFAGIAAAIEEHNPDVLVLTEFQDKSLRTLAPMLKNQGYIYGGYSGAQGTQNGLYLASKKRLHLQGPGLVTDAPQRALLATLDDTQLSLLCVHIPGSDDKKFDKSRFWDAILTCCRNPDATPDIIIGDFNTGLAPDAQGTPFACVGKMQSLLENDWKDAWRKVHGERSEFTWYSGAGNGFRLDHCLVKTTVGRSVRQAYYSHREREAGLSDHSLMVVELAL